MTPCANCGRETCPTLAPEYKGLGAPTYVQLDCERAKSAGLESKIAEEHRLLRGYFPDYFPGPDGKATDSDKPVIVADAIREMSADLLKAAKENSDALAEEAAHGAALREALRRAAAEMRRHRWDAATDLRPDVLAWVDRALAIPASESLARIQGLVDSAKVAEAELRELYKAVEDSEAAVLAARVVLSDDDAPEIVKQLRHAGNRLNRAWGAVLHRHSAILATAPATERKPE